MKLVDSEETVVIVTGSGFPARERDLPTAYRLKEEIDRRSDGQAFRRAVVVEDGCYILNPMLHVNTTISVGGPGANACTEELVKVLPVSWTQDQRAYVHADFEGDHKRAALWGVNAEATMLAVQTFVSQGFLDDLLRRIWRFRTEVYV